jgi:hypothetical protein
MPSLLSSVSLLDLATADANANKKCECKQESGSRRPEDGLIYVHGFRYDAHYDLRCLSCDIGKQNPSAVGHFLYLL